MRALLLAPVLWAVLCVAALAQTFPALTGRVVDNANLIEPADETALTQRLAAWERETGNQVVVATVENLDGRDIETYANLLAREWKLGRADIDDGVLLLVARDDRKLRIEVGYGLEGTLTDALSSRIINETMLPAFRADDFSGGIVRGAGQVLAVLGGAELPKPERTASYGEGEGGESIVFGLFMAFWLLFFVLPFFGRGRGKKGRRRRRGPGVVVLPGGFGGGGFGGGGFGGGFGGGGGGFGGGGASGGW